MRRIQLVEILGHDSSVAVFMDGDLILSASPMKGDDINAVYKTANSLALSVEESHETLEIEPNDVWSWGEVEATLKEEGSLFKSDVSPLIVSGTGRLVNIFDLQPEDFDVPMMARALSRVARFWGQTDRYFSVAEHTLNLERLVDDPIEKKWMMMHEIFESFTFDMVSPIKHSPQLAPFRRAEERCLERAADHFGLPRVAPPIIKELDKAIMVSEAIAYMPASDYDWGQISEPVPGLVLGDTMLPEEAEEAFLVKWYELFGSAPEQKVAIEEDTTFKEEPRAAVSQMRHP